MTNALKDQTRLPSRVGAAAKQLITDSLAKNTRRTYSSALAQLDAWLDGRELNDENLADYLGHLDDQGKAPATASIAVTAARFYARMLEEPSPAGPLTEMALKGFRREGRAERGRGQSSAFTDAEVKLMQRRACEPRPRGRGMEKKETAEARGAVDAALVGVLYQGALRRSEAAAMQWRDVKRGRNKGTLLIKVRKSKTNQDGKPDVRLVKGGTARALEAIRGKGARGRVFKGLSEHSINRRVKALAAHCGIDKRITSHSCRIGHASELTARGASAQEVMNSGNWKSARMVAHYAAGATAERGAVSKYL